MKKRRILRHGAGAGKLTEQQIVYLLNGNLWQQADPPFSFEDKAREAWKVHREELLARRHPGFESSGFDYYFSGERPWVWWQFEKHEPRRQIAGDPIEALSTELYEGIPNLWKERKEDVEFESQYAYLKRLNLLLPGEDEQVRETEKQPD